ncbi:MAG: efflux RND transporter periplasmic adaptor subunit [Piscirickettsiaceae bacterium CG_4_9_14_3_um_filter_43_564]|nr:efflux RND transporter periplasmic adaptor subunit [Thiomicrospira sp.]OIP96684.1 MAG: efflux transporter periplasmic adaptor subunit [Thiomicrospira sp. CG2_30_44_34]PIQ05027.1 MAG: efflux transporter periplasmic adaptor subunit [Piscirickettsiaceae bacterium CG18_big_fil_WC_8_21_14_2_50_44_103]PIU37966.1 MAG: efflux RND transporter periplasmic adaptor subunit [Piscirickettsiaceae bacterium CG07_land_8_20_14_0_80_44_28]PIW58125.1 MAG: efflux RND transporter periplasmic adaptor subunit [Pisc
MNVLSKSIWVGVVILGLVGCSDSPNGETAVAHSYQQIAAPVGQVTLGTIPLKAVVAGAVVPDQKAQIASRLMGYIKDFDVKVGQKVQAGDLLFSIDSNDVNSQILQAQSAYQQALAALEDAKLDYDRFSKLYKEDSVSKQQFDKVSLQYKVAKENLVSARSGFNQARSQLNYANVKAPFDGIVVEKLAVAGALAAPGNPVLVLENLTSLSVRTQVSEDLFAVLRNGDEAEVRIDGQPQPIMATIYTLVSAADPRSRTHTVKLSLPSVVNVNSGTFARVGFKRGERQTMMVPKSAIVNRSGIEGVFVVKDGTAYFHMVRLGESIGNRIEIKAGVNLGDQIVIDNNQSILNGDKIIAVSKTDDIKGAA